jgi:hypothetical protein
VTVWKERIVSDAGQIAESRCLCGKVKLQFLRPLPVLHVHCCCSDCRQGREWVASAGGPPMKQAATLVHYFENDLAPLEPDALSFLFSIKLRETGRTVRLVTNCCHSILAMDHPYYDQNVISVHKDACDLVAPPIQPLCRIFTRDWDTAYDGEMPPATASLEESEATWTKFAGIIKHPAGAAKGIRLQDIFAQLPPATILGLAEKVRLLPPAGPAA